MSGWPFWVSLICNKGDNEDNACLRGLIHSPFEIKACSSVVKISSVVCLKIPLYPFTNYFWKHRKQIYGLIFRVKSGAFMWPLKVSIDGSQVWGHVRITQGTLDQILWGGSRQAGRLQRGGGPSLSMLYNFARCDQVWELLPYTIIPELHCLWTD